MDKSGAKIKQMFSDLAPSYDLGNHLVTFGMHTRWKKQIATEVLRNHPHCRVLDLCTGSGDILLHLQKGAALVVGADFSFPMLKEAQKKQSMSLLLQGDALRLPFADGSFDVVTVGYGLRNVENLSTALAEIQRVLRSGGQLYVLESGSFDKANPISRIMKWYEDTLVPLIGKYVAGNRPAYEYLAESSQLFPSGQSFLQLLEDAGFQNTTFSTLFFGASFIYKAARP